ncbi:type ISP restriction/modification enzyme [Methylotenera versatilis]|uniref:site-specific DNA-methyltransferase (adenine-specific) n=1 Tax=Methylotenera versatilis (strain 301) TaxID=666681 RepID=D7DKP0_METV0|nr:type ISP restriction/modification enzyme [Methylotenera versatilis]ADI30486.1 adenine specific DNA methyltransferase [Methylotenera versatilis 301]
MNIQQYIGNVSSLFNTGNSTEHSYRGDLQQLLTSILKDVAVTNEPKRIECGAPDYILTRKDVPIGYIEAKDVGVKLGDKIHKEQFDRYKAALNNLVITDYLEFHFFKNGVLVNSVSIATIENGKIFAKPDSFDRFTALFENFALQITQTIKSPSTLAQMMAAKAKLMAQVIKSALDEDGKAQRSTDLQGQMAAFKSILIHDIDNTSFADIYAQTIAYGLFAARYHDPSLETFSRQEAATLIPQSNPFLRKLFQYIAGYELDIRLTWLVDELVSIFLATDVASVMHNFGKSTRQHDPIIHFYETFLAEYDPKLRKSRGVWYTPEPVVSFIVRAVDDILKTHFKLPLGLADTSKTKVTIEAIQAGSKGKLVKSEHELHKVQILDPATGTGTFLAQTVRHIYNSQFAKMQGAWSGYVKEHLIPRLNGFELLMTSYAMAHLKLDMLLTETGYKPEGNPERLRIYLTNSLEEHHPDTGTLFASWLSTEANEANHIKRDAPVMVVMGNPPYSGHSSNKGEWIEALLESYKKEPTGGKLQETNSKWLNDDYVKFIRYGQHFIDKNGEGVLAFITNHSYLDNPTFRGMRWALMQSFDDIYILDLHGNAKKKETAPDGGKDENVFDIQQGVSIAFMVKTGKKAKGASANIWHSEIFGKREYKYNYLNQSDINLINTRLKPSIPHYAWVERDETELVNYSLGFSIQALFPINSVGIVTARDNFTIHHSKEAVKKTIQKFLSINDDIARNEFSLGADVRDWKVAYARADLEKSEVNFDKYLSKISYRPFDDRFTYYTGHSKGFHCMPRGAVMRQLQGADNLGLVALRQVKTGDSYCHCFITKYIFESCLVSNRTSEIGYGFPLYIYPDTKDMLSDASRTPNLNMQIVKAIATSLQLTFTPEKTDNANAFSPIDLLDYIYAVLHSPTYRETYKEFLKIDFPRVPYPSDIKQFWLLVALGNELRQLHLLEDTAINQLITRYPEGGNNLVDKPRYDDGKVYINETQYFEGVPKLAWEFYIGGYQPAQKWLKDRKGHTLGYEDIVHYQKIIKAMVDTDRLMQEIDQYNVI